jgi:rubrerythrin
MGLFTRRSRSREDYVECRVCGTTLEDTDEECPHCGGGEVAVYRL